MAIITLGESLDKIKTFNNDNTNNITTNNKEEIQNYVNNMDDNEKKDYIFFLVEKVRQEKEEVKKALDVFETSLKHCPIVNEFTDFNVILSVYNKLIIPLVRGVYIPSSYQEEIEAKVLKKKIMGKLTLAHFDEYLKQKNK